MQSGIVKSSNNIWIRLALIVLAALLAHGLCLRDRWYLDDSLHFLWPQSPLQGDWWDSGWRRWSYLVWAALKSVFGMSEVAFHALNLVLHGAVAVTVFFVTRSLAGLGSRPRSPEESLRMATSAALLFAVHPAASEPIHYAAQTTIQWVTFFSMLAAIAVLALLRSPSVFRLVLTLLWITLAAYSKESGVIHAGMGVALIVGALAPWKEWKTRASQHKGLATAVIVCLLLVGGFLFVYSGWMARTKGVLETETFGENALTQCRMFWGYLLRTVVPVNLCSDHLVAASISSNDRHVVVGGGCIVLLLGVVGVLFVLKRRVVALLIALAVAPLLVRFAYPIYEVFVEYRLYPAMPWFAILFALGLQEIISRKQKSAAFRFLPHVVVVILIVLSIDRARDWRSPLSIGENVLAQYPDHTRIHTYLQAYETHEGHFEKVVKRQEQLRRAGGNLLTYNRRSARHHRRYDEKRVTINVMVGEGLAGFAEIQLKRPEDAIRRLDMVITNLKGYFGGHDGGDRFGRLYRTRGRAHAALGNIAAARADFQRAIERMPNDPDSHEALGNLPPATPGSGK